MLDFGTEIFEIQLAIRNLKLLPLQHESDALLTLSSTQPTPRPIFEDNPPSLNRSAKVLLPNALPASPDVPVLLYAPLHKFPKKDTRSSLEKVKNLCIERIQYWESIDRLARQCDGQPEQFEQVYRSIGYTRPTIQNILKDAKTEQPKKWFGKTRLDTLRVSFMENAARYRYVRELLDTHTLSNEELSFEVFEEFKFHFYFEKYILRSQRERGLLFEQNAQGDEALYRQRGMQYLQGCSKELSNLFAPFFPTTQQWVQMGTHLNAIILDPNNPLNTIKMGLANESIRINISPFYEKVKTHLVGEKTTFSKECNAINAKLAELRNPSTSQNLIVYMREERLRFIQLVRVKKEIDELNIRIKEHQQKQSCHRSFSSPKTP